MTQFDCDILINLWKWKLLTTAALTELHFSKHAPSYAHRRLLDLKKAGLIEWLHIKGDPNGRAFAWTLSKKGFESIQDELPALHEIGFRTEAIQHDLLVAAVHLGEWIYGVPQGCDLFSEQQLRRCHLGHYPSWIPKTEIHRPDGYWLTLIDNTPGVVALEVERSQKSPADYRAIAQFYSKRPELFRVVWVVRFKGVAQSIYEAVREIKGDGMGLHNFILEKDFREFGWNAKFFLGRDEGKSLARLLPNQITTSNPHVGSVLLLNTQKSPHRSDAYSKSQTSPISHRLDSSLVSTPLSSLPSNNPSKGDPTNE